MQMSAGRHQEVGPLTTRSQPVNFSLYKNIQYKNMQLGEIFFEDGDKSDTRQWLTTDDHKPILSPAGKNPLSA
jgi:hypothetical protein